MKDERSKLLLISAILASIYIICLVVYFGGLILGSKDLAPVLTMVIVIPHFILIALAVIFNWVGYFTNIRGLALTGAILYSVGGVISILYIIFVIPSIVLSFVGYAKLRKLIEVNNANESR